jgi:hypothetical protein
MFPSWRYHRTLEACIVADPLEDEALGDGWADTPAAFTEPEPEPQEAADECLSAKTTKKTSKKRTTS